MRKKTKIFVALDKSTIKETKKLIQSLDSKYCGVKIGKEAFTLGGPKLIEWTQKMNYEVFLDLKFHDIPNTVKNACKVAADLGVSIINVHSLGGIEMMRAGKDGVKSSNNLTKIIGVTLLTSHNQKNLTEIGIKNSIAYQILKLAKNTAKAGLDGIVCSAIDISIIKKELPKEFIYVTPGIRHENAKKDDQERIISPKGAILAGSNILVIGRPITLSKSPNEKLKEIYKEIN